MKYKYIKLLALLVLVVMGASCVNPREAELHEESSNINLSIRYSSDPVVVKNPLKASISDYEEYKVHNLYLFIVDGNGEILNRKFFKYEDLQEKKEYDGKTTTDLTQGVVDVKTMTTLKRIYAIANVEDTKSDFVSLSDGITTDFLEGVADETGVKNLFATLSQETLSRINGRLLMSGVLEVPTKPAPGSTLTIPLTRVVAKVEFIIKGGEGIKFTPLTWTVHRVPKKVSVFPSDDSNGRVNDATDFFDVETPKVFEGDAAGGEAANSFVYYQYENIKPAKKSITSFRARELQEKEPTTNGKVENGAWVNAPDNGTYVVLTGKYEKKEADGKITTAYVTYTVHLGFIRDGKPDFNDYNCRRNTHYIFEITVMGVEKIIVEAKAESETIEEESGAEGHVIRGPENIIFDSHYVQFVTKFERTLLESTFADLEKKGEDISSLYIVDTPYGSDDISWVEFYHNETNHTQVATYPGQNSPELMNVEGMLTFLKGAASDNTKFVKESDGKEYIYLTVFVNEYYYEDKDFWTFVNKPDRSMILRVGGSNYVSYDTKSEYSDSPFTIRQKSIKTGYSEGAPEALGFETLDESAGVTFRFDKPANYPDWNGLEDGTDAGKGKPIGNSRDDGWYNSVMAWGLTNGYGYQNHGTSGEDPRNDSYWSTTTNKKEIRLWSNYINRNRVVTVNEVNNLTDNGIPEGWGTYYLVEDGVEKTKKANRINPTTTSYNRARYACLSRNRDLNGDGYINKNEVRWYMPAEHQLTDIWQMSGSINREDHLYKQPSYYSGKSKYVHYLSSTVTAVGSIEYDLRNNLRVLWAEEGASTSHLINSVYWTNPRLEPSMHLNRCVRTLNKEHQPDAKVGPPSALQVFGTDKVIVALTYNGQKVDTNNYRDVDTDWLTGEYPSHSERSPFNRPASKFQVAKNYLSDLNSGDGRHGIRWIDRNSPTFGCSTYSETPADKGTWRVPNQRELQLMAEYDLVGTFTKMDYDRGDIKYEEIGKGIQVWSSTYYSNAAGTDNIARAFIGSDAGVALQLQMNSFTDQHRKDPNNNSPGFRLRCVRDYR
ncbi:hypothetical protein IX332_000112 [Porphyromonas levii]|uniref:DUF4906 domain-containing protein n=1 Tax=Porphyromonas levii TaxID=28114 RepID=UPI001B8D35DD|nr:DUF4906 domain-containing protein [Porphyromonas levii]MBR8728809.1 hypothetical protein [Porphyromonas levii]